MLQLERACYSIVELETSWEKETCIHVELGNFIFFPIWFRIVLHINRLLVINEEKQFFFQLYLITVLLVTIINLNFCHFSHCFLFHSKVK